MKKTLLLLVWTCLFGTGAMANETIVLDSTSTVRPAYITMPEYEIREYFYYDDQGRKLESKTYSSDNEMGELAYTNHTVNAYDDNGNMVKSSDYDINGTEILASYTEYSDFDAKHQPRQVISYNKDEDTYEFVPDTKIVYQYEGEMPIGAQLYQYAEGTWMPAGEMVATLTDFGTIATSTTNIEMNFEGTTIQLQRTQTYEYNDRHFPTKITTVSTTIYAGMSLGDETSVETYEYLEYDGYGNPKLYRIYTDGELTGTETDWYGPLKTNNGIASTLRDLSAPSTYYTLDGRCVGTSLVGQPNGIYIVKGKNGTHKVLIK